jgi:tetratricopeptide (TPR) repeat protein
MKRAYYLAGWSYVAVCAAIALPERRTVAPTPAPAQARPPEYVEAPAEAPAADGATWFRRVKPYCNAVEVHVLQRQSPPPATLDGVGYHAACLSLAGRIDEARKLVDKLPADQRRSAAAIVFDVGHPVADAGDDRSAGPIMELVIDYWPDHYMALYHAGMAEYMLGQRELATRNLEAFLQLYHENDGWRSNGLEVLGRLRDSTAARGDARRPREP